MAELAALAQPQTETKAPEPKPRTRVITMLAVAVVMAMAGFVTAKFVVMPIAASSPTAGQPGAAGAAQGEIVTFENVVVNPSGTMGQRYLSATIGLAVKDDAAKEAVESARPRVKDALITLLSAMTVAELTDPANREAIRETIREKVNEDIGPSEVVAVYFLDFVLQ